MCGILGVIRTKESQVSESYAKDCFRQILLASQERGKDSSGVCVVNDREMIVYKDKISAAHLLKKPQISALMASAGADLVLFGHSRMETNGSFLNNANNQPILKDGMVLVHNGIVVNDKEIWRKYTNELQKATEVDSEVIVSLLQHFRKQSYDLVSSLRQTFQELQGSYSIAAAFDDARALLLATNTGSLYFIDDRKRNFFAFASQEVFLKPHLVGKPELEITQVQPNTALVVGWENGLSCQTINLMSSEEKPFSIRNQLNRKTRFLGDDTIHVVVRGYSLSAQSVVEKLLFDEHRRIESVVATFKRCTRCILPDSMPFIHFDENGVCNYCHRHLPRETLGTDRLLKAVEPFRRKDGKPECVVSFSGGRDSSYALHYVKNVLGLNPVAYSYDWGMLTDLGRRNQARMTGQLGVEHILVSADIQVKRSYIRKNIVAWLKRPELGMVPLFMAGDKQYFYHLNRVQKEMNIPLVIYADNSLEKTDFKYGFAGVQLDAKVGKAYAIGPMNSAKLLSYYAKNYLVNSSYINSSLLDTFTAYVSSYFVKKDYLYLFRHILWEEHEIEDTLIKQYEWELAPDTRSSWRIGDGTAAFYNYIYYTIAGFTEHDTFRSNQIREGAITREEALRKSIEANVPRAESFLWYCDTIGIDPLASIKVINATPKLFERRLAYANAPQVLTTSSLG